MAHEWNSGFLVGRQAWHGLADVHAKSPETVNEVLEWMGGNDPSKLPVYAMNADGLYIPIPTHSAIMDEAEGKVFQIASDGYEIITRRELVEFSLALQDLTAEEFDTLATVSGAPPVQIVSAMTLREGAVAAICAKLSDDIVLADGTSHANLFLVCQTSHDGSLAFGGQITSIMTECMNTLSAGIQGARSKWSIKHTKNAKSRMEEARKALGIASKYRESFAATADALVSTPMPRATFESMIRDLYPDTGARQSLAPFSEEQYALLGVLDASTTINDAWRDTRWGGLNAVTEYETWLRKLNNTTRDEASRRLESDLWGRGAKKGDAAFAWLTKDLALSAS